MSLLILFNYLKLPHEPAINMIFDQKSEPAAKHPPVFFQHPGTLPHIENEQIVLSRINMSSVFCFAYTQLIFALLSECSGISPKIRYPNVGWAERSVTHHFADNDQHCFKGS